MNLKDYILQRAEKGYCYFTQEEAKIALESSDVALRRVISRLQEKGEIAEPHTGFHIIVPPEYKSLGCIPAELFIPDLMEYFDSQYYVCLLSAAQYHGAAHHRPQVFQVMVKAQIKNIRCGQVVIEFVTKKIMQDLPVDKINTKQGFLQISSPELTVMDLILYSGRSGGLDNVFMILSELADQIDIQKLLSLWEHKKETTWLQRLGYLFELAGQEEYAHAIESFLSDKRFRKRPLSVSSKVKEDTPFNERWKLWLNEIIEVE